MNFMKIGMFKVGYDLSYQNMVSGTIKRALKIQFSSLLTKKRLISICLCLLAFISPAISADIKIQSLPPLPDKEGFAGMFAGQCGNYFLAAGGANFPVGYPWEGGKKRWYSNIYAISIKKPDKWQKLQLSLPKAMGYGVCGSWHGKLIIAGGESGPAPGEPADKPAIILNQVFAIQEENNQFSLAPLPALSKPLKDACGTVVGDLFIVFGGIDNPNATSASSELFILNLNHPEKGWQKGPALPAAGRIQAVAATDNTNFILFSGIEITADATGKPARKMPYLQDAWRIKCQPDITKSAWARLPDLPAECAAAPSPAWSLADHRIVIAGGADSACHRLPQKDHPGWSGDLIIFDSLKEKWEIKPGIFAPFQSKVTATGLNFKGNYLIFSGEKSPGRRSPEILQLSIP